MGGWSPCCSLLCNQIFLEYLNCASLRDSRARSSFIRNILATSYRLTIKAGYTQVSSVCRWMNWRINRSLCQFVMLGVGGNGGKVMFSDLSQRFADPLPSYPLRGYCCIYSTMACVQCRDKGIMPTILGYLCNRLRNLRSRVMIMISFWNGNPWCAMLIDGVSERSVLCHSSDELGGGRDK